MDVAIDLIKPSPYQPRLFFELDDLKEEIQRDGLLSALVVRKKDEYYELLDGERRLRTLKEMGWKRVPIDIRDVDDQAARRSVFKLNKIRENYNTEEEARYYKKLAEEGRTAWEVSEELNVNFHWVLAHLNVFKFPESIQKSIWDGKYLTISHIHTLENVIGRNLDEALLMSSEIINRKISVADTRKIVSGRDKEADEQRLEAAKGALPKVVAGLETPEDYEKAAQALKEEAKKRAEEAMTPEEKAEKERKKLVAEARKSLNLTAKKIDRASQVMDVSEFRERLNNIDQTLEKEPGEVKTHLATLGQQVIEAENKAKAEAKAKQEEAKREQKAEEEQRRQERAEKKVREQLKGNKAFVAEALKAMPEEEVAEMLDMVPIPDKVKKVKSAEEEFDDIMKMASKVVDTLEKLKKEGKIEQLNLPRFLITLRILADSLDEFAKLAEGSL